LERHHRSRAETPAEVPCRGGTRIPVPFRDQLYAWLRTRGSGPIQL
jgi:hypothetical protein